MVSAEKAQFFDKMEELGLALTYDDVRLRTAASPDAPLPPVLDVNSRFSEHVGLKVPFVSAAMDTVTGGNMAIAMAKLGGLGVIHAGAGMSLDEQYKEVRRVKLAINGLIDHPVMFHQARSLEQILQECQDRGFDFRTFPIVDSDGKFVGILTGDDFKYADSMSVAVEEAMRPASDVVSAHVGTGLEDAFAVMRSRKINTLPLLTEDGRVGGMYLFSDVSRITRDSEQYNVDHRGQLVSAAAIPTSSDALERVAKLHKYLDVAVIDTADGDSFYAFQTLRDIKGAFPDLDVVVGNVSEGASARLLAEAGANGIKVGQGPGSICTTRTETGIGMPQVTAVYECVKALGKDFAHVPVCADGGIKAHGDISIALAAGAHSVMMGRMLAGTTEAPGELIVRPDGSRVKVYRGMGSAPALRDSPTSRERYGVQADGLMLAEGVEAYIPFEGPVGGVMQLCLKALLKSMRYVKAPDLTSHHQNTRFRRITNAGLRESHAHDVEVVKQ